MADTTTILVCVTCRRAPAAPAPAADAPGVPEPAGAALAVIATSTAAPEAPRAGAAMLATLGRGALPAGTRLRGVECLSACSNGCAVALTGPGRWTYVYGNLDPEAHGPEILAGAAAYAATPDGLVPWRERPLIFRRNAIARVPPPEMETP